MSSRADRPWSVRRAASSIRPMKLRHALFTVLVSIAAAACAKPAPKTLRLATTTSVHDSGLLAVLLPEFEKEDDVRVTVTAVGTGAAFKLARDGNADLLLVHDKKGEEEFIAAGDGASRTEFMWNTFEIAGPAADPAHVKGAASGADAMKKIAEAKSPFISRGDDFGTHRREKSFWTKLAIKPAWEGYRETGSGMADTLRVADEKEAYVLTDQGTRLGYKAPLRIVPLVANTDDLKNHYAVVRISKAKHPEADTDTAEILANWLASPATAQKIAAFKVGGQALFTPTTQGQ